MALVRAPASWHLGARPSSVPTSHLNLTYLIFEESRLVLTTCQGLNEAEDLGNRRRRVARGTGAWEDRGEVGLPSLGAFWAVTGLLLLISLFLITEILVFLCCWLCEVRPSAPEARG